MAQDFPSSRFLALATRLKEDLAKPKPGKPTEVLLTRGEAHVAMNACMQAVVKLSTKAPTLVDQALQALANSTKELDQAQKKWAELTQDCHDAEDTATLLGLALEVAEVELELKDRTAAHLAEVNRQMFEHLQRGKLDG